MVGIGEVGAATGGSEAGLTAGAAKLVGLISSSRLRQRNSEVFLNITNVVPPCKMNVVKYSKGKEPVGARSFPGSLPVLPNFRTVADGGLATVANDWCQ